MTADLRERARQALREQIAVAMSDLFAEHGFDAVTVEDAAREVGISRATFFRYFGSKEDAVLAAIEGVSIDFGAILMRLPAREGENSWQLLHRTFRRGLAGIDDSSERERARLRMIHTTPSLRARLVQRRSVHQDSLTTALTQRGIGSATARTAVVACLAAVGLAWQTWATGEQTSLDDALDEVFTHLDAASEPFTEQGREPRADDG